jgi:hypothetical protein
METYKELTAQARAFHQLQRGRPSATVRATRFVTPEGVCANESLPSRAEGAARPLLDLIRQRRHPHVHMIVMVGIVIGRQILVK